MQGATSAKLFAAFVLAVAPSYLVERITEYEFLTSSPTFFTWSGLRTELFISSILLGALITGRLGKRTPPSAGAFVPGVACLMALFYYFCDPRVCYSSGVDGLEPLRMGLFFSCIGVAGVSIGSYTTMKNNQPTRNEVLVLGMVTIGAVAWYPIMFEMAGTKLLTPFDPIPFLLVVALLCVAISIQVGKVAGWRLGLAAPVLMFLLLLVVALGIAKQYLPEVVPRVGLIVFASLAASLVGALAASRSGAHPFVHRVSSSPNRLVSVAVLLVLLMMAVFLPDAVNGVVPSSNAQVSNSPLAFGSPTYAGGFMTQSFLRTKGISVTVDFSGTNASAIQPDNFLSGGIGVHSPHCCVDGIDFGYRFDVYLFHDGAEELVATAWEVCDTIMACGGHSWQELLFSAQKPVEVSPSSSLHLILEWQNRTVYWTYSVNRSQTQYFASYVPPTQENAYFNAGVLGNVPSMPYGPTPFHYGLPSYFVPTISTGILFFQYGIMSRYPIGHGGWSVNFECPSYLDNGSWTCVSHSESVQGDQSYWKAVWHWGEPYANVEAVANGPSPRVTFSYSPASTLGSFEKLW